MATLPDNRGFDYFQPGGEPLEAVAGKSSSVGMDYFLPSGEPLDVLVTPPAAGGAIAATLVICSGSETTRTVIGNGCLVIRGLA